jgi:hypothetical protein
MINRIGLMLILLSSMIIAFVKTRLIEKLLIKTRKMKLSEMHDSSNSRHLCHQRLVKFQNSMVEIVQDDENQVDHFEVALDRVLRRCGFYLDRE